MRQRVLIRRQKFSCTDGLRHTRMSVNSRFLHCATECLIVRIIVATDNGALACVHARGHACDQALHPSVCDRTCCETCNATNFARLHRILFAADVYRRVSQISGGASTLIVLVFLELAECYLMGCHSFELQSRAPHVGIHASLHCVLEHNRCVSVFDFQAIQVSMMHVL